MSAAGTPADELLCALRRLAGDAASTARFNPSQWLSVTREIGLSDAQRGEAIAQLKAAGYVKFAPESTEILALTPSGVKAGDELAQRREAGRKLTDPMPDTLEAIREELDYWEPRQYEGEPGSIWWEQVKARLDGLRHRENRLLSVPSVSVTNNAYGPNSRFNQNSIDASTNQVALGVRSSDWERMAERLSQACRFMRADSQWTSTDRKEAWRIAGGNAGICTASLQQAGAMLLKSPNVRNRLPPEVSSEVDDVTRWLLYLKHCGFHQVDFPAFEEHEDGTRVTHMLGGIKDLAGNSAELCIRCAALET